MKNSKEAFQKLFKATLATSVAAGAVVTVAPFNADAAGFSDLKLSHVHYSSVMNLTDRGVIKGFNDGTFKPEASVTRGQAAKIIALTLDLDTKNVVNPNFKDIKTDNEYYGPIAALVAKGIVIGKEDGTYAPGEKLTRSQMAKIITLAFGFQEGKLTETKFKDVKANDWYNGYLQTLLDNEITTGTTATTFSPYANVKRGQMASFVVRAEAAAKPVTVISVSDNSVETSTGTYKIAEDLKKVFNATNAATLKNANIKFTEKDGQIVAVKSLEITADGTAAANIVLDGASSSVAGNVKVNGDYVTVKNLTINGDLAIGKGVETSFLADKIVVKGNTEVSNKTTGVSVAALPVAAKISFANSTLAKVVLNKLNASLNLTGTSSVTSINVDSNATVSADKNITIPSVIAGTGAGEITLNAATKDFLVSSLNFVLNGTAKIESLTIVKTDLKLTLGTSLALENLVLPGGKTASEVISNFNAVKGQIEEIGGVKNPDATPVTPPASGGSTGGGSTGGGNSGSTPQQPGTPGGNGGEETTVTPLELATAAKNKFKIAYDSGSLDWDTLITAIHYLQEARDAKADVKELENYYVSIESLDMSNKDTSKYDISTGALEDFTGLTNLNLSGVTKINELGGLIGLTKLKTLNISGTKVKELNVLWNETEARFPNLKNIQAENIVTLTSIAGLVEVTNASEFSSVGLMWNLGGSILSEDPDNHIDHITTKFTSGTFTAPTVEEATPLELATAAKNKFEIAYDSGSLDWDTLITAIHYLQEARDAKADVKELENYYVSIESLDMSNKDTSKYDISTGALEDFTGLTNLNLSGVTKINELGGLVGLTKLKTLNISGTKVKELNVLWNETEARFPNLKNLQAENIVTLTSIAGLVEVTNASEFSSVGLMWNLGGSILSEDPDNHIDHITTKFTSGTFTAPTVEEATPLELATAAKNKFEIAYDSGSLDWDTLITAIHYLQEARDAKADVKELENYYVSIESLDMSNKDTSKYDISTGALEDFTGLTNLNLSGVTKINELGGLVGLTKLKTLNISGTKVKELNVLWNETEARFPNLKNLQAENIVTLTSIAGLVEVTNASEFSSVGLMWNLGGSILSEDPDNHIDHITTKFTSGTFTAPTVEEATPLELATAAKNKFEIAYDSGSLDWDTLITAIHYLQEARDAKADVKELENYYVSIESLDMSNKDTSKYDISTGALEDFTGLTSLNLSGVTKINELGGLVGLTKLKTLNISGTKVKELNVLWNETEARFPNLKNLQAENIVTLTSIAGLVEVTNASEFSSVGLMWNLGGSILSEDPDNHIDHIKSKFASGGFTAPTVEEATPLELGTAATLNIAESFVIQNGIVKFI